jgi:hypothetical protein
VSETTTGKKRIAERPDEEIDTVCQRIDEGERMRLGVVARQYFEGLADLLHRARAEGPGETALPSD